MPRVLPHPARQARPGMNSRGHGDAGGASGAWAIAVSRPAADLSRGSSRPPLPRCSTRSTAASRSAGSKRHSLAESERRIGFRAPGPTAVPHRQLDGAGSPCDLGIGRVVQGLGAPRMVEPRAGRIFELFSANAVALGEVGRAKGPFRWINALAHRLRDNAPAKARRTSPPTTTSATTSTPPGSTRR